MLWCNILCTITKLLYLWQLLTMTTYWLLQWKCVSILSFISCNRQIMAQKQIEQRIKCGRTFNLQYGNIGVLSVLLTEREYLLPFSYIFHHIPHRPLSSVVHVFKKRNTDSSKINIWSSNLIEEGSFRSYSSGGEEKPQQGCWEIY